MKKLAFAMVLLCTTATAQITSFPYTEDFESGAGGWTSATLVGGDSWNLGTPDGTVIDQAAPGGTMSWFVDTLNTGVNEQSHVISPVFDFTNVPYPTLEIDVWWDLVDDSDGAVFQSSIDGGSTWQNVGHHDDDPAFAPNWFNHGFLSMGFPNGGAGSQNVSHWTGDGAAGSLGWVAAGHYLEGLGGQPDVRLRMAWINKTNNLNHPANGIAFDNIHIYNLPELDLAISDVSQAGPCGGGYPGQALVTVQNLGAGSSTFDFFQDSLGTNFPINQTTLPGFGTAQILVELPLQNPGDTTVNVGVVDPSDSNPDNNYYAGSFNCNIISGLNHCNNFENNSVATWFADPEGTNSSWSSGGNSTNNTINTPFSGNSFWGTTGPDGGYNPNEQSSIVSPFFDFSNLQNSGLSIQLWTDLETSYDGGVLQYSLDGGATWFNVGTQGSGTNWFNAGALSGGGSGGQNVANWNGATGGWVNAINTTPLLDGATNVLFRVSIGADDIFQDAGIGLDDFCVIGEVVSQVDTPDLVINEVVFVTEDSVVVEIYNRETVDVVFAGHTLSASDGVVGPNIFLAGTITALGYHVVGFVPDIFISQSSMSLRKDGIELDAVCIGDAASLNAIGVTCPEGNVEYIYGALPGCSLSRIPNGEDSNSNGTDFSFVTSTIGTENQAVPCAIVGIESEAVNRLKLYPNPARDFIRLETESQDQFDIQILNALGSVAKPIKISDQGRIDISAMVPGVYSIIATDSNGKSAVGRFIRQ